MLYIHRFLGDVYLVNLGNFLYLVQDLTMRDQAESVTGLKLDMRDDGRM